MRGIYKIYFKIKGGEMLRKALVLFLLIFMSGCFAIVDNQGEVSRVKTFVITDDETLELLDKVENKDSSEKHKVRFFKGQ
jgi:hypothetical protein